MNKFVKLIQAVVAFQVALFEIYNSDIREQNSVKNADKIFKELELRYKEYKKDLP